MPLQSAIGNAIANTTVVPDVFVFTQSTQEKSDRRDNQRAITLMIDTYGFAIFAAFFLIIFRHVALISQEREAGMSQLIDAMGGGSAAVSRVMGWLLTFNLTTLPIFIIFGALYKTLLFKSANVGVLIGWQILLGMAVNSSTVFAASFFKGGRMSAIYVVVAFFVLAAGGQVYACQRPPNNAYPEVGPVYLLTALFPSKNFAFSLIQFCLWELMGESASPPS